MTAADAWRRRVSDVLSLRMWAPRTGDDEAAGVMVAAAGDDSVLFAWTSQEGFERALTGGADAPVPYLSTTGADLVSLLPADCGLLVNHGMPNPLLIAPDDLQAYRDSAAVAG